MSTPVVCRCKNRFLVPKHVRRIGISCTRGGHQTSCDAGRQSSRDRATKRQHVVRSRLHEQALHEAAIKAVPIPIPAATVAVRVVSLSTCASNRRGDAPSAARMPSSRRLRATTTQTSPTRPAVARTDASSPNKLRARMTNRHGAVSLLNSALGHLFKIAGEPPFNDRDPRLDPRATYSCFLSRS